MQTSFFERPAPVAARVPVSPGSRAQAIAAAGMLLVAAGVVILLGIITAESLYPATYTTHDNEISDLGATVPPNSIIRQPSAWIFNATMMTSGAMLLGASYSLRRAESPRRAWISIALLGLGVLGVGIFPGNRAPMHGLFALLAFVSGGVAAILSAKMQAQPARAISVSLGTICLVSLVVGLFGTSTVVYTRLGDGGIERWIAYPVVLWMAIFGGSLLGRQRPRATAD